MIRSSLFCAVVFSFSACVATAGMRMSFYALSPNDARALTPPKILSLLQANPSKGSTLDIDKMWHGIHFLLTGSAEPTNAPGSLAIFGGKEVGDDLGYGPARLLSPSDVKLVAQLLKDTSVEKLRARYDAKKMDQLQIYPSIWLSEGDDAFNELAASYRMLAAFYEKTAAAGQAMLLVIE
jgi:hypothetical protein